MRLADLESQHHLIMDFRAEVIQQREFWETRLRGIGDRVNIPEDIAHGLRRVYRVWVELENERESIERQIGLVEDMILHIEELFD